MIGTLLNALFGTDFAVMSTERREQTTQGLWLSRSNIPGVLVMDVEGTDGRERGEDQRMSHKSALFSLSIADVLLINLFETDVGRYNGANYGLLKVVLEANLNQFLSKKVTKTLLLFVLRDCSGRISKESLSNSLKDDMNNVWSGLRKVLCGHYRFEYVFVYDTGP